MLSEAAEQRGKVCRVNVAVIFEKAGAEIFRFVVWCEQPGDLAAGVHEAMLEFQHRASSQDLLDADLIIRFDRA